MVICGWLPCSVRNLATDHPMAAPARDIPIRFGMLRLSPGNSTLFGNGMLIGLMCWASIPIW